MFWKPNVVLGLNQAGNSQESYHIHSSIYLALNKKNLKMKINTVKQILLKIITCIYDIFDLIRFFFALLKFIFQMENSGIKYIKCKYLHIL